MTLRIFDQRIAGKERGLELQGDLERRKSLFRLWARPHRVLGRRKASAKEDD